MQIIEHKLQGVRFQGSGNHGGRLIRPSLVVVHHTGGLSLNVAVASLCDSRRFIPSKGTSPRRRSRRSAHLVIGRSGEVVQLVPFDLVAWHAGESVWRGKTHVNLFSIGIELENPGWLERGEGGRWCASVNHAYSFDDEEVLVARHRSGGPERGWRRFSDEQLMAVDEVTAALVATYPTLTEGVGHEDVAPARKVGPGPAFPMAKWRATHVGGGTPVA